MRPARIRRRGFSNATLLIAVAVMVAIALLSMIESGGFDPGAMVAKTTAKPASSGKKVKPPLLYPPQELPGVINELLETQANLPTGERASRELRQAIAGMDSKAAAEMLAELEVTVVADLLVDQRERDLARILETADPVDAAEWVMAIRNEIDNRRREALLGGSSLSRMPTTPTDELLDESSGVGELDPAEGTVEEGGATSTTPGEEEPGEEAARSPAENGSSAAAPVPPGSNIA